MSRGRRDADACAVGDTIDGWTVEAYEPDRRLRLSADLKLPGHGWLEFEVTPLDDGTRSIIRQTAIFDPRGLMGRAYWYAILPIHNLMFRGMLERIARHAIDAEGRSDRALFTYRSVVPCRAADLFRWHERPEALMELLSSRRFVRIERQTGGLENGGCVVFSVGVGPLRLRWEARHYGYVRGTAVLRRTGARAVQDLAAYAPDRADRHRAELCTRIASNTPCRAAARASAGRARAPASAHAGVRAAASNRPRGDVWCVAALTSKNASELATQGIRSLQVAAPGGVV